MITEAEILDRHVQALGEARTACVELSRNMDVDHIAPRGRHYKALKEALQRLEGTCRQMNYQREDTRWIRLGILYAKAMRTAQKAFVGQRWAAFKQMMTLFEMGQRNMTDLRDQKTGQRGAILPTRGTSWLILPDSQPALPQVGDPPSFALMPCAVEGCGRRLNARGYCSTHYAEMVRDGFLPRVKRRSGEAAIYIRDVLFAA